MDKILLLAKQGDEESQEWIIKKYKGFVWKQNKMLGGNEDSSQVGIIAIFEAIKTYDKAFNQTFGTYVYKKVKYAILNYLKKERKNKTLNIDEYEVEMQQEIAEDEKIKLLKLYLEALTESEKNKIGRAHV